MTFPVRPNAAAEEEFRDSIKWYERESPGLGDRLWLEIQAAIALIEERPAIGEAIDRTIWRSWRWHTRAESLGTGVID